MPSKSRGGLSKREYAAAAKVKAAPKAKPKTVSPLVGAGPLLPGQTRQANSYGGGSQLQGAGPLMPGQTRTKDSYTGGSSDSEKRRKAAAIANTKNYGLDVESALNSGGLKVNEYSLPVSQRPSTISQQAPSTFLGNLKNKAIGGMMDVFGKYGQQSVANSLGRDLGSLSLTDEQRGRNRQAAYDNTIGIPGANAAVQPDLPQVNDQYEQDLQALFGPKQTQPDFGSALESGGLTEGPTDNGRSRFAELFAPTARAEGNVNNDKNENRYIPNTDFGTGTDVIYNDPTLVDEMGFEQQQNELHGGEKLVDTSSGTTGNRSGRGNGLYGTGKGLMSDDPYIKELRKAYSSNGGEKWLRKQFEELIAALDPTYAQMQKEGTDALNAQLNNQNIQLASVMNANNTGDSEQRAQLMAGQQRDTQTALGNLLAKLAQGKAGEVSNYRSQMADKMGQLKDRNQTNQQRLLEQIQQYKQQQLVNSRAGGSGANKQQAAIQALLKRAAGMPSGGREYAASQAKVLGLGNIGDYTPNGWENAYNPDFGAPSKAQSPTRSQNPMPEEQEDGTVIDNNPYSPTYGMEMVQA